MESILFHPKVVHLPIALGVLMPVLSLSILLAWFKGWLPAKAWWLVVLFQGLLVVSGVAALRTGEADEDRVEKIVSERLIEHHEEAAQVFVVGAGIVLLVALGGGLLRAEKLSRALAATAVAGTLGVLALGYRTGQAGGELVYRHGAASAWSTPGPAAPGGTEAPAHGEPNEHKKDDDDD